MAECERSNVWMHFSMSSSSNKVVTCYYVSVSRPIQSEAGRPTCHPGWTTK